MPPIELSSQGTLETHPYVGIEPRDRKHMLDVIGVKSIDELFVELPVHLQNPNIRLSPPLSEIELRRKFGEMAAKNTRVDGSDGMISFLGGATSLHFVPTVVGEITGWGEFLTAYTAYQAEVSQGTLETAFDYESDVCELNGMEVSNTGMYDGASAMAEGALMAAVITGRKKVVADAAVDPKIIEVVKTYCYGKGIEVVVAESGQSVGLDNETAAYLVQTPNYMGTIEDLERIQKSAEAVGAKTVVSADQLSLAILKAPGEYRADIVVGEAQSLGNMPNFGGPNLGVFTAKKEYVPKMPGRIVGQGEDIEGKIAYTLIRQAREQHIKREKATSNICTSQQLVALGMTVYMRLAGRDGLQEIARQNYHKAHYAADQLQNITGVSLSQPDGVFFNRFVIKSPIAADVLSKRLLDDHGILGEDVSAIAENGVAFTFTEMSTREQIDELARVLTEISNKDSWVDPGDKKLSSHVKRSESNLADSKTPLRMGFTIPSLDVPEYELPSHELLRQTLNIPEGESELETIRRYKKLADKNFGIETGSYPLGSCTMKLNPKVNDAIASDAGFTATHPEQPEALVQGNMQILYELQNALSTISGMDATSTTPMAGAQGELAGILIAKKYFEKRGETQRRKILIPDSAHGTNPATAAMAGFEVVNIKSDKDGNIDMEDLKKHLGPDVACMMLTYPSTLGLPETNVEEIAKLLHEQGALFYCDGANMNALVGRLRPGDVGFDIMHYNLHKTFSTPHGGGGPGASAVSVKAALESFLPTPLVKFNPDNVDSNQYEFAKPENSIGRMGGAYGNFGNLVRALVYIDALGKEGLKLISDTAVLNANYLQARLKEVCDIPHGDRKSMHEFIISVAKFKKKGLDASDFAKALIDAGFHPPTIHFPLVVDEAMMFEPTEAETLADLDRLIAAIEIIWAQAEEDPEKLKEAPITAPIRRIKDAEANRKPVYHHDWNKLAV